MDIKKQLEEYLFDLEKVTKAFNIEPFDIYLLGGSACILGGFIDRATRDFDFVDLNNTLYNDTTPGSGLEDGFPQAMR